MVRTRGVSNEAGPSNTSRSKQRHSEAFHGVNTYNGTFVTKDGQDRMTRLPDKFISERGLKITPGNYPWIDQVFEERKWEEFRKTPKDGRAQIVKEFYANLPDRHENRVFVRGVWVPMSKHVINEFFTLDAVKRSDDVYRKMMKSPPTYDELVDYLCIEGTSVDRVEIHNKFSFKTINQKAAFFLHWIGNRLLPTTYFTEVTLERAYLAYAFMTHKKPIDIGRIIFKEMCAPIKSNQRLGFPNLITEICVSAGVKVDKVHDVAVKVMKPVTDSIVSNYGAEEGEMDDEEPVRSKNRNQRQILESLEKDFDTMKVSMRALQESQARQEMMGRHTLRALRFLARQGNMTGYPVIPNEFYEAGGSSGIPHDDDAPPEDDVPPEL